MDKKEFEIQLISLKDKIFRFSRTLLGSSYEAEDVTQDIYEKLWIKKEELSKYDSIESFVIQSTKNLCYDKIRHRKVVIKNSAEIKQVSPSSTEPENDHAETSELIRNAIQKLPKKQKTIMHLRDIEGYEFSEISKITGDDLNAIRVNLSRARKSVKIELIKKMNYGL